MSIRRALVISGGVLLLAYAVNGLLASTGQSWESLQADVTRRIRGLLEGEGLSSEQGAG